MNATSHPFSARVRPLRGLIYLFAMALAIVPGMANSTLAQTDKMPRKPVLDGDWWQICKMPDLGELNGPVSRKMNVVDHGFVQATNGKWQLWACLRGTAISRLIYGWEGDSLEEGPWKPQGVKVRADTKFGESIRGEKETAGAPFFLKRGDKYLCLFHSGGFRLMESEDGLNFTRVQQQHGSSATRIPGGRDVMVLEHNGTEFKIKAPEVIRHDNKWYISDLHDFQGIRMTRLRWDEDKKE